MDLMISVIEHVLGRWQTELLVTLGTPCNHSTIPERVRAFVQFVCGGGATKGWLAANGIWMVEATGILTVTPGQGEELLAILEAHL